MARRRTAARSRVIRGSASPRSPEFFQKTSPVFKSFSKIYYARIVKSPLIPALQRRRGKDKDRKTLEDRYQHEDMSRRRGDGVGAYAIDATRRLVRGETVTRRITEAQG